MAAHTPQFVELMKSCRQCDLAVARTQVVVGHYGPKHGLCFIGEAPGYYEDKQGQPFVGRSGQLLDTMLATIDLARRDISILNIVKCRPPNNRTPTDLECKTCGQLYLQTQLEYLQPRLIITLGRVPLQYFFPKLSMTPSKGKVLQTELGVSLIPFFHPSYILRGGGPMEYKYRGDFQLLVPFLKQEEAASRHTKPKRPIRHTLDDYFKST